VGITAGSREVPGRNACDRRHTYCIIIIIIRRRRRRRMLWAVLGDKITLNVSISIGNKLKILQL